MKPQLVRSASKSRSLRASELGETKKGEIHSGGIDFLELTPARPPQLAPVKVHFVVTLFNLLLQWLDSLGFDLLYTPMLELQHTAQSLNP